MFTCSNAIAYNLRKCQLMNNYFLQITSNTDLICGAGYFFVVSSFFWSPVYIVLLVYSNSYETLMRIYSYVYGLTMISIRFVLVTMKFMQLSYRKSYSTALRRPLSK